MFKNLVDYLRVYNFALHLIGYATALEAVFKTF